ncbi:FAD-binding domain-containing protein [Hypoxylon trugodes]|uniref:FAD-binding domain-containing protein n=1 Tax=Hypoxylon trugodes TaxID=326681 RepID=UPI00219B9B96|nr:FAD-binding domain-containing protein [Hypoxylon trugodes]KAI1383499.1 FAD-binding domain-containing protein [Hypoxylon trugodes]
MATSIRNAMLIALAAVPVVQSVAQIPVKISNSATPVLRAETECAGDVTCACQILRETLTDMNATVYPSDGATYEDFEDENYSAACRLPAACIVSPRTAEEVSTAIKILSQTGTKFAVRSGGHNYIPGFASVDEDGVLISLSGLNTTVLSADRKTAKVGPGNRWQAVYEALVPEGLVVVGGRVGPVGVGGLTLGGGLSYFATQRGLGLDNVKSYEVVLADSSIVTVSADNEYSDLYKGLRGGAANFGIVTNYELYTYPVGNFYVDARAYSSNQTDDFLRAVAEYQKEGQLDPLSSVSGIMLSLFNTKFPTTSPVMQMTCIQLIESGPTILLLYNEPVEEPKAFGAFYNLGSYTPILPAFNGTLLDVLALTGSRFSTGNIRTYGETFSHKADADLMVELYDIFVEETANLPSDASEVWVPNPIAASVATVGKQNGGNLLGMEEVPQQWYEWYITWTDPTEDQTIWDISQRITQRCVDAAKAKNLSLPYLFMNTAGKKQNVLNSYGAENVAFIKATAAKYDPTQVFQKLQNDGFLIRNL